MTFYTIKPLVWRSLPPAVHDWIADTTIGEARVRYYEAKGWCWMFSDKTAWLPCESEAEGKALAEAKYRASLISGALEEVPLAEC